MINVNETVERRPASNGAAPKNRLTTYPEGTYEAPPVSRPGLLVSGLIRIDVSRIGPGDEHLLARRVQELAHQRPGVRAELVVRRGQDYPGSAVEYVRSSGCVLRIEVVCDDTLTVESWMRAFREGAQTW